MRLGSTVVIGLAALFVAPAAALAQVAAPCVETGRPDPSNPALAFQRAAFGFHDEEIVICSPGAGNPTHIAARLWVPATCVESACAGVVMAHGFGFSKEVTFADMYTAVGKGLYVLSYDVRGQGASGGQAAMLGRDDVADQAAVLAWWHQHVGPTKTAFSGISQGGWLSWAAAIFNCGAARAASYDSAVPCDEGGRWIDAIAPMQAPMQTIDDGTCTLFQAQAFVESRANLALIESMQSCLATGQPGGIAGAFIDELTRLDRIDVPVYAVTSFYDRLVPPRQTIAAYEALHQRTLQAGDLLFGKDVRLIISNDGHGDVGGNTAVTGDVFAWITNQIDGGPALRGPTVAIAQEWSGNTFRLEEGWPIPGTSTTALYLARAAAGELAADSHGTPDELRNLPVPWTAPSLPAGGTLVETNSDREVPGSRLVYSSGPFGATTEITGEPVATIYVSSANADHLGTGQLHVGLSELLPDGSAHEFSHARVGLAGLGPDPMPQQVRLSVSGHRIDAGNKLMLVITSSDLTEALPAPGMDPFYIHHDAAAPSAIVLPIVGVGRTPPAGDPPSGSAYTDDPVGTICAVFGLPC